MGTRCKASAFPQRLGSLRLPHFPQTRRRNYLQTINQGVGPFYSIGVGSFYVIEARPGFGFEESLVFSQLLASLDSAFCGQS